MAGVEQLQALENSYLYHKSAHKPILSDSLSYLGTQMFLEASHDRVMLGCWLPAHVGLTDSEKANR